MSSQAGTPTMDEKAGHDVETSSRDVSDAGSAPVGSHTLAVSKDPVAKRTWRSYVWDTFDKSPEERRFLFKLDAVILTFASLGESLPRVSVSSIFLSPFKTRTFLASRLTQPLTPTVPRVLHQVPRPGQCEQRICLRHERGHGS
jgi:ACS family pantothenate transporter-like MFS transporter